MSIGASVLLIVVGAILTFALNVSISSLDLDLVGWILMAAGVVGLILSLAVWGPRRRRQVTQRRTYRDGDDTVQEESTSDSGRTPPPPA